MTPIMHLPLITSLSRNTSSYIFVFTLIILSSFTTAFYISNASYRRHYLYHENRFIFCPHSPSPPSFTIHCNRHLKTTTTTSLSDTSNDPFTIDDVVVTKEDEAGIRLPKVVLITGFESFNRALYESSITSTSSFNEFVDLRVFSDSSIRTGVGISSNLNPILGEALDGADVVIVSLVFDRDDVESLINVLVDIPTRLLFECASELMVFNRIGTFSMGGGGVGVADAPGGTWTDDDETSTQSSPPSSGTPPIVRSLMNALTGGREEDKLSAYVKLLKVGPDLLRFVPGEKASDIRRWLLAYRYWNQGGETNVRSMMRLLIGGLHETSPTKTYGDTNENCGTENGDGNGKRLTIPDIADNPPELEVTPDIGCIHPLLRLDDEYNNNNKQKYPLNPASYLKWRMSQRCIDLARNVGFVLAESSFSSSSSSSSPPRVAVLLYRKHVITSLPYVDQLLTMMENNGILPIPVFINGVEAHAIVRDYLSSWSKEKNGGEGRLLGSVRVDAILSTIGFPLVGGPAGSMEAGRDVDLSEKLLAEMNVPYMIAAPLLLQGLDEWREGVDGCGVTGLQAVALYSLPELDGAIDTIVLGGLRGDNVVLIPERVKKATDRIKAWVNLRRTPKNERRIAVVLYGFPPNVGAVGTAALLDVPSSLEQLLVRMHEEGYDVGGFANDPNACGESLVAALAVLCEETVTTRGALRMHDAVAGRILAATDGDKTAPSTLSRPGGGLGGAKVYSVAVPPRDLEDILGGTMYGRMEKAWPDRGTGPATSANGDAIVSGLLVGNVFVCVQPALGIEGDPMRLMYERDTTPHPQYVAAYEWMRRPIVDGGIGALAFVHLGTHGTVEWLPGRALGNDDKSWSDILVGNIPNVYVYAANNPSEGMLAKRRGYGTLISYNVPPYGRAGLYLELAELRDLVGEYRADASRKKIVEKEVGSDSSPLGSDDELREEILAKAISSGLEHDVPILKDPINDDNFDFSREIFDDWVLKLSNYLDELQDRLFSSGLHTLGSLPSDSELASYLNAYFGDVIKEECCNQIIAEQSDRNHAKATPDANQPFIELWSQLEVLKAKFGINKEPSLESEIDSVASNSTTFDTINNVREEQNVKNQILSEAKEIVSLLQKNTEELDSVINALDGGYIRPKPGGDLLRDGTSVLPTGRNIHALDPFRMPSASAWIRGKQIAKETLKQHLLENNGKYPETIAITLWGLDTIKTRGESIAVILALIGAKPVKEGTGRVVLFGLIPLEELRRPRIDVLASMSGIFRDSFANIMNLLDDMFERCVSADEPEEMNFVKKHANDLANDGVERPAARLFSNPPGDYGSMVNEVVGTGEWTDKESLGETWEKRNVFSYGRNEGGSGGLARPEVLNKLLETTERIIQEVDSVEYGLTDIQEYYANTGALKIAAENRTPLDMDTSKKKAVAVSVVEAFGGPGDVTSNVRVRNLQDVLRLEYRSKLLNPKWRDAMINKGSGGAYEVSQRMTAMVGWAATAEIDNFIFDQAAERYALDPEVAKKIQTANPEAFKNVIRRLLEASGRGMWITDDCTLEKLRNLYSDADDLVEKVA